MLKQRREHPAFHPNGKQQVLFVHEALFGLLRTSPDGQSQVICLQNVSDQSHQVSVNLSSIPLKNSNSFKDLISGQKYLATNGQLEMMVNPYQVCWLVC